GTTLTVQILTFNIAQFASIFIFIGVIFIMFIKKHAWRSIGQISLSIGFIFFGIGLITSSLEPLGENEQMLEFLAGLSEKPIVLAFIAMILTALMHSSSSMYIIRHAFIPSGVVTLLAVLSIFLGANDGSTLLVVMSSRASRIEGIKLSLFYFLFKSTSVVITMTLLTFITY